MASAQPEPVAVVLMPSAVPVPRGPSVLLLGSADGLFATPGCPACRYTAESSDSYLAWFALEGHADPDVLHRLCASRGMCARHTRRLFAQPGAADRLTAVYRYVLAAALRDPSAEPAQCPACEQHAGAEDRLLAAVLDALAAGTRAEYKLHGGLCLPHLRSLARHSKRVDVRWLIRFMIMRLRASAADVDLLAGAPDPDDAVRGRLRAALPSRPESVPSELCMSCWAAADAERTWLASLLTSDDGAGGALPGDRLCGPHLRDSAGADGLLGMQAEQEAECLARVLDGKPRLLGIAPGWLSPQARRALEDPACAVCRRGAEVAAARRSPQQTCVRHLARMRATDPAAARSAASVLADRGREIAGQLDAEFSIRIRMGPSRGTSHHRLVAWRHAAALLDGSVLTCCRADQP